MASIAVDAPPRAPLKPCPCETCSQEFLKLNLALELVELRCAPKRLDVMPILLRLFTLELSFSSRQIGGAPIWPVLMNGRLKLADMLGGCVDLQVHDAVDVHPIVCLLGRGIEKVHHRNLVGLQVALQELVRKVEPELGGAHRVDGVVRSHPMVRLV